MTAPMTSIKDRVTDTLQLPASSLLRLTSGREDWLNGKFVACNWDWDELETKWKGRIVEDDALVARLAVPL